MMIQIKTNGPMGAGTKVFQNGVEIDDVIKIEISPILPDECIYATITVLCDDLEIIEAQDTMVLSGGARE